MTRYDINQGARPVPALAERDAEAAHLSDYLLLLGSGIISFFLLGFGVMKFLGWF